MTSRRAVILGGAAAAVSLATGGFLLLRGDGAPVGPVRRQSSAFDIAMSLVAIPGVTLDLAAESIGDGAQRLVATLTNDSEVGLALAELEVCHGGSRIYVTGDTLAVVSVNRYRIDPRSVSHSGILVDPLIVLGPGQSFREHIEFEKNVRPCEIGDDGLPNVREPLGLGGPVRRALVAYDVLLFDDASELFMNEGGDVFPRRSPPRWMRVGGWVRLARPVQATPEGTRPRRVVVDRPSPPPLTASHPHTGKR